MSHGEKTSARRLTRVPVLFGKVSALLDEIERSKAGAEGLIDSAEGDAGRLVLGERCILELYSPFSLAPTDVIAEVLAPPRRLSNGHFEVAVRYSAEPVGESSLEWVLQRILDRQGWEKQRRHPRLPVNAVAADALVGARKFLLRDLSMGGMGLVVVGDVRVPGAKGSSVRVPVQLEPGRTVELRGEIVWTFENAEKGEEARFGIRFSEMSELQKAAVRLLMQRRKAHRLELEFELADRF